MDGYIVMSKPTYMLVMKKTLSIIAAVSLFSACGTVDEEYVSHIRFDITETKVSQFSEDDKTVIIWEEGDALEFTVSVTPPESEEYTLSMLQGKDVFYCQVKGLFILEEGTWTTYVDNGIELKQTTEIEVVSPRKDAKVEVDYKYSSIDLFFQRHLSVPFTEGDQVVAINLGELFE